MKMKIIILIIHKTIFIVLSSMAQSHMWEFTLSILSELVSSWWLTIVGQTQTWPLSPPVGCYRPNIHSSPCIITHPWGWYLFTVPRRIKGWVDLHTAVSVQPVPKAACSVIFMKTQKIVLSAGSILGPLAPQVSVLPLDNCDLTWHFTKWKYSGMSSKWCTLMEIEQVSHHIGKHRISATDT